MNRRLQEISVRDGLTGLYNRRYFQDRLPQEVERSQRPHRPMGLIMVDVDHFKRVNDTYGHQVGDEVLRGVALVLISQTRAIDIVCLYGGEEFAVILPETGEEGTLKVAERLRETVALTAAYRIELPAGETQAVRCTVALLDGDTRAGAHELLSSADTVLYAAKHGGRNRVVVAPPVTYTTTAAPFLTHLPNMTQHATGHSPRNEPTQAG